MATGDKADIVSRLRAVLPARWFPDTAPGVASNTPILDAALAGIANVWAQVFSALSYATLQARIATATDVFLDMIGVDFFGPAMTRQQLESDAHYRTRLQAAMLRPRGTRAALVQALVTLTNRAPTIFEPAWPPDTGVWGVTCGWGVAGGWGNLAMPFQCLVTAFRPQGGGVSVVAGWGIPVGGWGGGAIEYANLSMENEEVSDEQIAVAIAGVMPAATIAWLRISN
ncbi:MAG: hypothetical protein P4L86_22715 [Mycobacterium sp.]|nr:hypothetical protein [Mycobacterium sp.]